MRKLVAGITIVAVALLAACGGNNNNKHGNDKKAKGNVNYGGVFRVNEVSDFRSLYPLNITEVVAHRITNQVYEGLVKLNQEDLSVEPCLAERWEISDDAKTFSKCHPSILCKSENLDFLRSGSCLMDPI